ncbi:MAL61 Maltose permease MAL61 [Candida maltosa Xu316]
MTIDDYNPEKKQISSESIVSLDGKATTSHVSVTENPNVDDYISKFLDMSNTARAEDERDKTMPLKECIRTFPKACLWSVVISTAIVMEGYDTNLLASFYAYDGFARKFGKYFPDIGEYQVPAKDQLGLSMCYQTGGLIGVYIGGTLVDTLGYRLVMIPALLTSIGLIFMQFFAPNVHVLMGAYFLLGVNWGSYQTVCVSYAMDIAPTTLRLYLTTYINCCWVFGQLISSGVIKAISNMTDPHAYRIAFAIQWAWPLPIAFAIFLAPESPYFLVRKNRLTQAKKSLTRLLSENEFLPDKEVIAQSMLTKIQMTIKEEDAISKGSSIIECFKGANFRRTRIAAFTWLIQNITGSSLMGYSTYFYQNAGVPVSMSFNFSIIQYCLGILGTLGSWFLSQKMGRFPIYFYGLCAMTVLLLLTGGMGTSDKKSLSMATGTMLLLYTFVYDLTIGPLCYCIVGEIPSSKLRAKTVMLARNLYNIAGIIVAIVTPYMLNPTEWNWKAKSAFLWAGFAIASAIWVYFELPETRGRTFAEIDKMFEDRVPARQFKHTVPKTFDAGELMEKMGNEGVKAVINDTEHVENAEIEVKA